jgi:hypothetical protein
MLTKRPSGPELCYLTPDAPLSSGTGLFKHKPTGLTMAPKMKMEHIIWNY